MDIESLNKHIKRFADQLTKLPQEAEGDILEREIVSFPKIWPIESRVN